MIKFKDLMKKSKLTKSKKNLIKAIDEAREELILAQNYFDSVKEPNLIDYAIYREQAARLKYIYLLNQAKKLKIKINYKNLVKNIDVV
ncbi:hypothetical protein CLOACE_19940 [Clostridium acetireducens DSM 10703]|uniref:DUF2508 domain-containing protein n=1 Tax=Clostridium acetireducens DSM 10703 TaxID=1121290 RepID=A0A1E8EWK3_9CLOT|nr:DUF2508 family protein [Clostridium acetireducens]OFI04980.1 hypothetical protein CLOACE_19940 [Clostridium acetireducens DSM 10703]